MSARWLCALLAVGCVASPHDGHDEEHNGQSNKDSGDLPPPIITIAGETYTPNAATQYYLEAGQTLTPGGTAELDGTVYMLDKSAQAIVVASSADAISKPVFTTPPPTLLIGTQTVTALSSQGSKGPTFIVGGQTLTPEGEVIVKGTTISLAKDATAVAIDGMTAFVLLDAPTRPPALLTFNDKTYTGSSRRNALYTLPTYVIDGQTLTPGGEITVDGTPLALASDASAVVYDGETQTISNSPASASAVVTNPPLLTIDGQTYTADEGTSYDIEGETLAPGSAVTVGDTEYSLAPSATALVADGETTALFPATAAAQSGGTGRSTNTRGGGGGGDSAPTSSDIAIAGLSAARGLELAGPLALMAAILGL